MRSVRDSLILLLLGELAVLGQPEFSSSFNKESVVGYYSAKIDHIINLRNRIVDLHTEEKED